MYTLRRMPDFDRWLDSLRDRQTRLRLLRRLEKAQRGLLGDIASVGDGVFEDTLLIVMLGGGDKSSQAADIVAAKVLAASLED
jgi:putative component of toxin-antitoxin plasmid stabilization module